MKANEALEKIYINPLLMEEGESIVRHCTFERQSDSQVEYTRTDAFIEKVEEEYHRFLEEEWFNTLAKPKTVSEMMFLTAQHFAQWQKEKVSSIVKQYADKGEKNYQESVAESIGAAYQQDVYWDGFRDCANGIKRELED